MPDEALLERLAAHRTIGGVPREQLEWLAAHAHPETFDTGDIVTTKAGPVHGLYVILDGHLSISVDLGNGPRVVMEFHGGDVTGILPYSRIKAPPGNVVAERRTETLRLDPPDIRPMIRDCYELTAVMVHVMLDRVRVFKSNELHDEKMASLGKLAAGLAHELNTPASAVARSAKTLVAEVERLDTINKQLGQLNLSDTQYFNIAQLRDQRVTKPIPLSPLAIADREDALADWLDEHGVTDVPTEMLAAKAFEPSDLDQLSEQVGVEKVGTVLAHISTEQTLRRLAKEIDAAASRIHALVAAVKGFTYMDQESVLQPIAVGRGIADTITVLNSKARSKSVEIKCDISPDLPTVDGFGGELNQVWANLLDNAIDASPKGHSRVTACTEHGKVVVRVIDDGHGVPQAVLNRIFDPFFTTKPVGEGTGLGLDIARRIVHRHQGAIDVATSDKGTEFRVTLPASAARP